MRFEKLRKQTPKMRKRGVESPATLAVGSGPPAVNLRRQPEPSEPFPLRSPPVIEGLDSVDRPIAYVAVVVSAFFVVLGVALPQAAESILRLLLILAPLGYVAARAYRILEPIRSATLQYSPFDRTSVLPSRRVMPERILKLAVDLRDVDSPRLAERTRIPIAALRTVRAEAARRLDERHGLSIDNPDHFPEIRAIVSTPTLRLVLPSAEAEPASAGQPTEIPVSQLGHILDDLERL